MFNRRRVDENGIDEKGRNTETALRQHIAWCLDVFINNRPDSPELISYMLNENPTYSALSER